MACKLETSPSFDRREIELYLELSETLNRFGKIHKPSLKDVFFASGTSQYEHQKICVKVPTTSQGKELGVEVQRFGDGNYVNAEISDLKLGFRFNTSPLFGRLSRYFGVSSFYKIGGGGDRGIIEPTQELFDFWMDVVRALKVRVAGRHFSPQFRERHNIDLSKYDLEASFN